MKKFVFFLSIMFTLSLLFVSCSPNQPSAQVIKKFIDEQYPPAHMEIYRGIYYLRKTTYAEVKNKWSDENKKGVFYFDVEIEMHAYESTDGKNYGREKANRKLFTYQYNRKGDIWEIEKNPIGTKLIWGPNYL